MANFAILDGNNNVVNIIVADSIGDLSNYTNVIEDNKKDPAGINFIYDSISDNFINPTIPIEEVLN